MSDAHVRLRATYVHPRGEEWARPGGPWDVPALDEALHRAPGPPSPDVDAVAGGLWDEGVRPGDVVAWQRPNGSDAVLLYRACWRLGAVAAPVHHLAGAANVAAALGLLHPRLFVGLDAPLPHSGVPAGSTGVDAARRPAGGVPVPSGGVDVAPDALAVALCTSGSTGGPKVVLHTHRGLVYKARLMAAVHEVGPDDHILMPAPLAHVSGLLNGVLVPGVSGMRVTLMARWEPEAALDVIERARVTFMIGPPTFFVALMEAAGFSPGRVASLRLVSCGGAGVTPAFVERAAVTLGCRVKRTYGSTEAPTVTTWSDGDPDERARTTDGRPTGVAELRVADPASGRELPAGDVGELWVRGPEVFVGYSDPAATAAAFTDDGWFRTADLGRVDATSWLTVAGRLGDVIIRGGENIAAGEVEAVLEAHPAVRQAVVVGAPDDRLGERVCAFVVASAPISLADCRAWFADRGVTRFTWPERIETVDELPLLPSGKPDRSALRARLSPRR